MTARPHAFPARPSPARLAFAAAVAFAALGFGPAQAGECPKDKVLTQPRKIEDVPEKDLKRETLAVISLKGWRGVGDLLLRTRRLTIGPGGYVPTHYHNDRPSIVFIVKGEILEHSTSCSVPILHKAGEWTPEFGDFHGHWWHNVSSSEVVLTSSDVIPPDQQDAPM
jgi:quercetin dioxygenase-like cupin family protein